MEREWEVTLPAGTVQRLLGLKSPANLETAFVRDGRIIILVWSEQEPKPEVPGAVGATVREVGRGV